MTRTLQASDLVPMEIHERTIYRDGEWLPSELYRPHPGFRRPGQNETFIFGLIRYEDREIGCSFSPESFEDAHAQAQRISAELGVPIAYKVSECQLTDEVPEGFRIIRSTEWQTVTP